jgi:hypothetical protein
MMKKLILVLMLIATMGCIENKSRLITATNVAQEVYTDVGYAKNEWYDSGELFEYIPSVWIIGPVTISMTNGAVTIKDGISMDEASKEFWRIIESAYPYCFPNVNNRTTGGDSVTPDDGSGLFWWTEVIANTNRYKHDDVVKVMQAASFWSTHIGDTFIGDPRNDPRVRKAMQEYRMAHPVCEYDKGTVSIEIHHILPITPFPEFAACKWNMISLSEDAHLWVGHAGNYKRYVPNIRKICNMVIVVERDTMNNQLTSLSRTYCDSNGVPIHPIDWTNRTVYDSNGVPVHSIDWSNRIHYDFQLNDFMGSEKGE